MKTNDEDGSVIVIVAICITVMVIFFAGLLRYEWREAERIQAGTCADAAALSFAWSEHVEQNNGQDDARQIAQANGCRVDYLDSNDVDWVTVTACTASDVCAKADATWDEEGVRLTA